MECLMKKEEPSSNELIKTLEKNVAILKIENHYNSKVSYELDVKLVYFHNVSRSLADKLESLWKLAEAHQPTENEIKQFADQIAGLWTSINRQICEKYSKIRMGSGTLHGVPLSIILNKIKKEIILFKVSLQRHESIYDQEHILKGYKLITKSEKFISSLQKCDSKLQQLLCISNIMPRLIKLQSAIDKYVTTIELLPRSFPAYDLSAFALVTKLLTGELLGYESIDPSYVLMENMPKKPVFIIKNVKRKSIHPYYPT
ncbi:uncharacterized protein LOC132904703 [Bombus pascuorum]|uniref:uncharacterized protein LOC132904703 n=1 Tax=Bombus pascuorum TaxID=65598 RepID=UPI002129236E|nr:uncharacterized protein LOC132904703 [Bombus pascuorum]